MAVSRIARAALMFFLMLTMVNMRLLWGQSGTSSAVAGSVLDKSGAAIPRAQVMATEVNTGSVRVVQSNQEGRYLFSQVNPGTYRIDVRVEGFGAGQSQPTATLLLGADSEIADCASHRHGSSGIGGARHVETARVGVFEGDGRNVGDAGCVPRSADRNRAF